MSATIKEGKMSFSVFGRGYDDTRVSSGEGVEGEVDKYNLGIAYATFNDDGDKIWLACNGNGHTAGLLKYDVETFTEESHTIPTSANVCCLFHAPNVANNLGLVIQGSDWWVFDLTTEAITASGTDANLPNYVDWTSGQFDCVLDGTIIKLSRIAKTKSYLWTVSLDYSDGTISYASIGSDRCSGAFVNTNLVYMNYPPQWFYQNKSIEGKTVGGTTVWNHIASLSGNDGFADISMNGFGRKGRLYVPTQYYSAWRMGEYNGTRTPDFETPKPISLFGKFESMPTITQFAHSDEQKRVAFTTDLGVFVSDYEDIELLSEDTEKVLAINDNYVVTNIGDSYINVFKYR